LRLGVLLGSGGSEEGGMDLDEGSPVLGGSGQYVNQHGFGYGFGIGRPVYLSPAPSESVPHFGWSGQSLNRLVTGETTFSFSWPGCLSSLSFSCLLAPLFCLLPLLRYACIYCTNSHILRITPNLHHIIIILGPYLFYVVIILPLDRLVTDLLDCLEQIRLRQKRQESIHTFFIHFILPIFHISSLIAKCI